MDPKQHGRGGHPQNHGQHYAKHTFDQSQYTDTGGQLPPYSAAGSQFASSQGVHFKLTSNHPQTTSGLSSVFSGTEQTNQNQYPYQVFGRESSDVAYNFTDQKTDRDKIVIENYEDNNQVAISGEIFKHNTPALTSGVMSLESQPSAHFYHSNQQSLPTERFPMNQPLINVNVGSNSQSIQYSGDEQQQYSGRPVIAKNQQSVKMTKRMKEKVQKSGHKNIDISPTLGPSSRDSDRGKKLETDFPDLSQTTLNDQSHAENYNTIAEVSGLVSARSNANTGLQRGPTTIGQKIGIKIICRIAPTKTLSRAMPQNTRQSMSSSRLSSTKVAVNAGQHIYMETGRNLESPTAAGDRRLMGQQQMHHSVKSTANYLYSQISSPSAVGTIGRHKQGFRAASSDSQQNSAQHRLLHASGRSMNSEKKGAAGKRANSQMRGGQNKESLIASGLLKHVHSKYLMEEGHYSIFTTRNPSRFVVVNDTPFLGKTLNELFADIEDVKHLQVGQQNQISGGSYQSPQQPVIFKFDSVYDEAMAGRQDKIYLQNLQPMIHNFIEGQSGTVLLFGPTASGKTYTLKGGQGSERGLVPRAVDDILQLIKGQENRELDKTPNFYSSNSGPSKEHKIFLKASICMLTPQKIVDLIAKKGKYSSFANNNSKDKEKVPHLQHYFDQEQNAIMSQVMDLNERLILCPEDFYIALADAFRSRKELSLNEFRDKELRKKTHFIISFTLMQQHFQSGQQKFVQVSQFNFVELSGSEQAVPQVASGSAIDQISQKETQQFVSKSFNSLSCQIMKLVQRKKNMNLSSARTTTNNVLGSGDDDESKLVACLRQTMTAQSNVLLINCVEPSPIMLEHALPSIKFCSSLREHIKKKMKKVPREKLKGQKSSARNTSRVKSKSKSRSKSKGRDGHQSNSKSARKSNFSQKVKEVDWNKAIQKKIDALKVNFMNQEQQLENGDRDEAVLQKLGDLLLESQALHKEIQNQQASESMREKDIDWDQLLNSAQYLNNKILGMICQYSQQQQYAQQVMGGSVDYQSGPNPMTQRNTIQHSQQPSLGGNLVQANQDDSNSVSQKQNSQNNYTQSNQASSSQYQMNTTSAIGSQQNVTIGRTSIPSSTNLTSSHVQTTNPTFSVAVNTRNSEYKFGTTGHTGTNYDNGSLYQGSIDNRNAQGNILGSMNNPQIAVALGPIMSEHEQTSSNNDGHLLTNEGEPINKYENNDTFSDMPNQGMNQNQQVYGGQQMQQQFQQHPDNPYRNNNMSNMKGSLGVGSASSMGGNHYETFQNNNLPVFNGIGFPNQQQFNTVDNRQPAAMVTGGGAQNIQIFDNMQQRTNSRSRANMNNIWQNQNQPQGQNNSQMQQQEGGTFYRSDRDNSQDQRMLMQNHPHLNQQQRAITSSSEQKKQQSHPTFENVNSRTDSQMNYQCSSGYKHHGGGSKYKNLVQQFESKFSQIRRDLPKPEFFKETDLPDESKIVEDLRAQGQDYSAFEHEMSVQLNKYFDDLRDKSLTYNSEDELKGDVSRLMLLNDQEGLKLRFAQLYRERDNIIKHAKDQIQKIRPIERQKSILSVQLSTIMRLFNQNSDLFQNYLVMLEERYQETEYELMEELKEKNGLVEQLQENKTQMEETIDQLKKQFEDANQQRQEEHKLRLETDSKMKEVADENAKLRQNYDVLKEHEMSIIRDCENRKQQEIKVQQDLLEKEREVNSEQFQKIEKLKVEINQLEQRLRELEKESKTHESEKIMYYDRSEQYSIEIQQLNQEISTLKQKSCEDIELIKIMRLNADTLKKEKQELSDKILELQRTAKSNEQSVENQHNMFQRLQGEVKKLEMELEQIAADKQGLKDQIKTIKNEHNSELTQKDLVIQKVKDDLEEMNRKNKTQQSLIAARNEELVNIKAKQFDKVDLLQKLSETEGKLKQMEDEKNRANQQKEEVQSKCDQLQNEVAMIQQSNDQIRQEMERMRHQQDNDFDQFEGKFDELNKQVERFTLENADLKQKLQQNREEIRESEKQKSYWREKCRVAERKGDQINHKIVELENELRTIIFERNQKQQISFDVANSSQAFARKSSGGAGNDSRSIENYHEIERTTFNTIDSGNVGFASQSHQASAARRPPLQHQTLGSSMNYGAQHEYQTYQPLLNRSKYEMESQRRPAGNNAIHIENESNQAQITGNMHASPADVSRSSSVSRGQGRYEPNQTKNSEPPLRSNASHT